MCRRPQCCLCQSLLILPAEACAPPWNVIRLEMSELLPSIFPDCHSFHLQGTRNVVLSLGNLTVSNPYSANRPISPLILQHLSQLISRYRPRSASVATGLLSMDMLPFAAAFESTSSGSHSSSSELSLGGSSPSLEMSYCGACFD